MYEAHRFSSGEGGFSLVELLIAMAVGLVVLGAVYSVFIIQNKTFSSSGRFGGDAAEREGGHGHHDQGNKLGGI